MKNFFYKLGENLLKKAYLALPVMYVMLVLFLNAVANTQFQLIWVIFLLALGGIISYCYTIGKDIHYDYVPMIHNKNLTIWQKFVNLIKPLASLHGVIIVTFLFLTGYAMYRGLDSLFADGALFIKGRHGYVAVFTVVVCLTMLWLLLMIMQKKRIAVFVIFYILFDLLSAFSFNFVHFYDNVSTTQRMDREMKKCRMYLDVQKYKLAEIRSQVATQIENKKNSEDGVIQEYNESIDIFEKAQDDYQKDMEKYEKYYLEYLENMKIFNSTKQEMIANGASEEEINELKKPTAIEKPKKPTIKKPTKTEEQKNLTQDLKILQGISNNIDSLIILKDTITILCNKYKSSRDDFSNESLQKTKDAVTELQSGMEALVANADFKRYVIDTDICMTNDTVAFVISSLQSNDDDRFASLNKLLELACKLLDKKKDSDSNVTLLGTEVVANIDAQSQSLVKFKQEQESFENRLLLLGIMLSALIDLLPLALSLFIVYSEKQDEEQLIG